MEIAHFSIDSSIIWGKSRELYEIKPQIKNWGNAENEISLVHDKRNRKYETKDGENKEKI